MTTVSSRRWFEAHCLAKESVASITAFPSKKTAIILLKIFETLLRQAPAGNPRSERTLVPEWG
jgi:hypothetical protein